MEKKEKNPEEITTKSEKKLWIVYGAILLAIAAGAFLLRVLPMFSAVFGPSWVNFQGPDGIYHLRLVENLVHHFPIRIHFDPYTFFPGGQVVAFAPLYDYIAGLAAWVIGLGHPSQHLVQSVAAFVPATLGALVTIPIYFAGKALWNRNAGLIAAAILGILPGTFLFRSRLGYFDHHVAEVFFSTLFMAALILTMKYISEHPLTLNAIQHKNWRLVWKPVVFLVLTGITLGLYLLVWLGALLFVFLFFCFLLVMMIIEHLRKQPTESTGLAGALVFLFALFTILPFLNQMMLGTLEVFALCFGLIATLALAAVSKILEFKRVKPVFYPLAIVGLAIVGFLALYLIFPDLYHSAISKFSVFKPSEVGLTVAEERPFLSKQGHFSLAPLWSEFTLGSIIAPMAFIILIGGLFKKVTGNKILILVWSILVFCATLGQVRFSYYLAVIVALLSGYFYSEIIALIKKLFTQFNKKAALSAGPDTAPKRKLKGQAKLEYDKKTAAQQDMAVPTSAKSIGIKVGVISLSAIIIFMAGIFPNIKPAISIAGSNAGINVEWRNALLWMKSNTPNPFQSDDYYYQQYKTPYTYPSSAYGVLAWWDYGHLITQIGHRIPNANPTQAGAGSAGQYFVTENVKDAANQLAQMGTRYIIIDFDIAVPYAIENNSIIGTKFYALPTWANIDVSKYCEIYYQNKNNNYYPVPMYYPDYYYCMVTRLYNFHASAVTPQNSTTVISFTEQAGKKLIQTSQTFATYDEANVFVKKQPSSNYRIVGTSPFVSPVPLEKLDDYKEVYKSQSGVAYNNQRSNSGYIEIFEYTK
jgi:dolichyl-phosphooligosaccharide-protein glycotransferase